MLRKPKTYDFQVYGTEGSTIDKEVIDAEYVIYQLDPDGNNPAETRSIVNPDFNYISLRGNAVLRWEYLAGSTLYLVWTQTREDYNPNGEFNFGRSMDGMFNVHPNNIFMVKLSYLL